jgi:hypothetical protein
MRRRATVAVIVTAAIASDCGGSGTTASTACRGLPHPKRAPRFLVLFGAGLTKRDVCAQFGVPTSVTREASGREIWRYGTPAASLTLKGEHVVATSQGKTPVGG